MNGLSLRVSSNGKNKKNPAATFNQVRIPDNLAHEIAKKHEMFKEFIDSNEKMQLALLGKLSMKYNQNKYNVSDTLEFLAIVFLYAESKHPAQCFAIRYIMKNETLIPAFTDALIKQIKLILSKEHSGYMCYRAPVEQLCSCIDNEPAANALRQLELQLMDYLNNCLVNCMSALNENTLDSLDKNELFAIVHTTFRLLLFLVQKLSEDSRNDVEPLLRSIEACIVQLLSELETPMDTKSVGSILFITLYIRENGPDSWKDIIEQPTNDKLAEILNNGSAKLSLVSGVATVVPTAELYSTLINEEPAMLTLTDAIIGVGEQQSCDTVVLLGVARALCAVSRTLGAGGRAGAALAGRLLPFVWAHLEHGVDSVGHLCATALGHVVDHCATLDKQGDAVPLEALVAALCALERTRKSFYLGVSALARALGAVRVLRLLPGLIEDTAALLSHQPVQASALSCLEKLLERHVREVPRAEVRRAWLAPLLHASAAHDAAALGLLQRLLVRAVELDACHLDYIMEHVAAVCASDDLSGEELKRALTLLAVCRRCGAFNEGPLDADDPDDTPESKDEDAPATDEESKDIVSDGEEDSKDKDDPNKDTSDKDERSKDVPGSKDTPGSNDEEPEFDVEVEDDDEKWKGILSYSVLERAAVDDLLETRTLALSLVAEGPRSTEPLSARELRWTLMFLRHNAAAQTPSFRQAVLALMKKLLGRLEDGYAALRRARRPARHCLVFVERLTAACCRSLLPGANYGRRQVALQILSWVCEALSAKAKAVKMGDRWVDKRPDLAQDHSDAGLPGLWREEYVEILLRHLDDSYDTNKRLALDMLHRAPKDMFQKKYSTSLELADIVRQASAVRPSECVAAAHKMELLLYQRPDSLPEHPSVADDGGQFLRYRFRYRAVKAVLVEARAQLEQLRGSLLRARDAPLHGVLHLLRSLLLLRPRELSLFGVLDTYPQWRVATEDILQLCYDASAVVAPVVNSASPEGHLPMDATPLEGSDGVVQVDGRHVTAQMVLLCAWRTVREVCLILGHIASHVCWNDDPRNLPLARLHDIGAHFAALLTELKHRGAFEQAYVGYTIMLASLWKHREPALRELPAAWLDQLMAAVASGDTQLCATRRSAGLPFMIQALVTTELAAGGRRWAGCVRRLLRLGGGAAADTRVHCANVLRALFRCGALRDHLPPHAPAAMLLALRGFHADTWSERNSATLLFAALVTWTFGVQRSRDADALCSRNTMTGRMFFQRYPQLYDHMLSELRELTGGEGPRALSGAQFPVLLLLARLHPSPLEGTVSNFKVSSFVPLVRACGRGAARAARRLSARALPPLLAPRTYLPAITEMLQCVCDARQPNNYRHGTILQLTKIFEAKVEVLNSEELCDAQLRELLQATAGVLRQARGAKPCYVLADDYLKMLNSVMARYPSLLDTEFLAEIKSQLYQLLFVSERQKYHPGMQLCLANAASMHLVITHILDCTQEVLDFIHKCLTHDIYEVVLSALNYLLIVHKVIETEDKIQEHLDVMCNKSNMSTKLVLEKDTFKHLCEILKTNKYLECQQKALEVLTLSEGTQEYIIRGKYREAATEGAVIDTLIDLVNNEHGNFTHSYLHSLSDFVSIRMLHGGISDMKMLEVIRTMFACATADNSEEARAVVARFVEATCEPLFTAELAALAEDEQFEFRATLYSTLVVLLEDESAALRRRAAGVVAGVVARVSAPRPLAGAAELLLASVRDAALCVLLALLDFRSEVQMTDDVSDECRVFDQNERHNAYSEETVWARACAEEIACARRVPDVPAYVHALSEQPRHRAAFAALCGRNVSDVISGRAGDDVNPKIKVFVDTLTNCNA